MPEAPVIAIFAQNAAQNRYLADVVRFSGGTVASADNQMEASLTLVAGKSVCASENKNVHVISKAVRAATLVTQIQKNLSAGKHLPAQLAFAAGVLDVRESLWMGRDNEEYRLTEKEVEILAFLHMAGGNTVTREELLQKVWAYAKDVETHTLETHIYRLRQKIEVDPANPQILLTKDNGYAGAI